MTAGQGRGGKSIDCIEGVWLGRRSLERYGNGRWMKRLTSGESMACGESAGNIGLILDAERWRMESAARRMEGTDCGRIVRKLAAVFFCALARNDGKGKRGYVWKLLEL